MTTIAAAIPQARSRYALRPVVVPADLAELRGPDSGQVTLPQRLFWSGPGRTFDIADTDQVLEMYEAVFDAARSAADLGEYVNTGLLIRLWPELALAPRVRRAWEAAHPRLCPVTALAAPVAPAA
ncbi:MAG TPA: hypothetical protein VG164_08870 [Trebonia sp.]|nr:hypothetical protein [Trebonia sp.]